MGIWSFRWLKILELFSFYNGTVLFFHIMLNLPFCWWCLMVYFCFHSALLAVHRAFHFVCGIWNIFPGEKEGFILKFGVICHYGGSVG